MLRVFFIPLFHITNSFTSINSFYLTTYGLCLCQIGIILLLPHAGFGDAEDMTESSVVTHLSRASRINYNGSIMYFFKMCKACFHLEKREG
jgi:hypothetical protein